MHDNKLNHEVCKACSPSRLFFMVFLPAFLKVSLPCKFPLNLCRIQYTFHQKRQLCDEEFFAILPLGLTPNHSSLHMQAKHHSWAKKSGSMFQLSGGWSISGNRRTLLTHPDILHPIQAVICTLGHSSMQKCSLFLQRHASNVTKTSTRTCQQHCSYSVLSLRHCTKWQDSVGYTCR